MAHQESCRGCDEPDVLSKAHLRVQLSPPDEPWVMLRFCDLLCLQSWLDDEAESDAPVVFLKPRWIDSHA